MESDPIDLSLVNEIRQSTNGNFVLGKSRFVEEIERTLKQRAIPGRSGRPATKRKEI
jgi:putative transposase